MKTKEEIRCSLFRTLNTTQPPIAVTLGEVHHPIHFPGLYAQVKHHISHFEAPCLEEELILNFYRKPKLGEQGGARTPRYCRASMPG